MNRIDLSNQRFGRLVVIEMVGTKTGHSIWKCLCDCGNVRLNVDSNLKTGSTKSCGCLQIDNLRKRSTTHGDTPKKGHAVEYAVWRSMKARCYNPKNKAYASYGGRGITVCDPWQSYAVFLSDMGRRPSPNHSIDRLDNNGNYCKTNCRWVTHQEQIDNRRNTRMLTWNDQTKPLGTWAKELDIPYHYIHTRLYHGWSVDRALSTPVKRRASSNRS